MCHPSLPQVEVSDQFEVGVLTLPEHIPVEIIYVFENIFNQQDTIGHIIEIDGEEYIFYIEV